jgi:hypothetical protein
MGLSNRFYDRFLGLDRAHGFYDLSAVKRRSKDGKLEGKGRTVKEAVTAELWERHLEGKQGIGIVPIRDDATCVFGAIDIDVYDGMDLTAIDRKVQELGLPFIVCRTKSGGAHLYCFFSEPLPASLVRDRLMEWTIALGHPQVEVFPKQSELDTASDDCGSWINMPYFDIKKTTRYAVRDNEILSATEFLDLADTLAVNEAGFKAIKLKQDELLADGPPCLQHIAVAGFPIGTRNKALFNLGVLCQKKYGDTWKEKTLEFNKRYLVPPLTTNEAGVVIRSLEKKNYFFTCHDSPLNSACNRSICAQREFGISGTTDDPGVVLSGLTKVGTNPPTWYVSVNGIRIKLPNTESLLQQCKFIPLCVEVLNILPSKIRSNAWDTIIRGLLEKVEESDAPDDAGETGQFLYLLEQYFSGPTMARDKEDLILGKPWEEGGYIYFRSTEMLRYMEKYRVKINPVGAWNILHDHLSATTTQFNIKGRCVRCWKVRMFFTKQTENLNVPEVDEGEF